MECVKAGPSRKTGAIYEITCTVTFNGFACALGYVGIYFWPVLPGDPVGGALAGRVIMSDRSTHGTVAWVLSLILLPLLGVPIYLIFGRNKLGSYIRARRQVNEEFCRIHPADPEHPLMAKAIEDQAPQLTGILEEFAKLPLSSGNSAEFMFEGRSTFDSMLEGIERAREYILFQFFIFRNDSEGKKFGS